jgi:hypothetical protein
VIRNRIRLFGRMAGRTATNVPAWRKTAAAPGARRRNGRELLLSCRR